MKWTYTHSHMRLNNNNNGPTTLSWWRGLVPVRFAPDGEARSRPGVTFAGGPTVQSDTGQNYYIVQGRCPKPRLPSHGHRLHMPYQGCEGTPDWVDVLALGRKRRLRSTRFVLVIRWTAAGRRGAGGGWVAAAVAVARVGRSRGAVVQFFDKVVITFSLSCSNLLFL